MYIEQTKGLTTTGGLLSEPKRLNTEENNPFKKRIKKFNDDALPSSEQK